MHSNTLILVVGYALLIAFACPGCGPESVEVDAVSDLVGEWQGRVIGDPEDQEIGVIRGALIIQPDGTILGAKTWERVEQGSTDTYEIWFEDGEMRMIGLEEYCGDIVGHYQPQILTDGSLRFSSVLDECTVRREVFEGEQDPAHANPHELEFVRRE